MKALLITLSVSLALAALAVHARYYMPFVADDTFISLRYAQRLLEGHGLTWTDGSPAVEGYSNLLWVLLAAALGACGVDMLVAVRVLGFIFMGVTVWALAYGQRTIDGRSGTGTFLAPLAFASSAPAAVWTIGGLEQPLLAALVTWAVVLSFPLVSDRRTAALNILVTSLPLSFACLTRPDGVIFTMCIVSGVLLAKGIDRNALRTCALLIALPLATVAAQMVFRILYYGDWIPNTARAKLSPSWTHLMDGISYTAWGVVSMLPYSAIGMAVLAWALCNRHSAVRDHVRRMLLTTAPLMGWITYVIIIGGDAMASWRHLVVAIALWSMLLGQGVDYISFHLPKPLPRGALVVTLVSGLAVSAFFQPRTGRNETALTERWQLRGAAVGRMLKDGFMDKQPTLAIAAAGVIPYYSGLPAIDMLGLNDYHLSRNRPADFGAGEIAHELRDSDYVLERKPDLVMITFGDKPRFPAETDLLAEPAFQREYRLIELRAKEINAVVPVWIRTSSEKIGIRTAGKNVLIPSYFFTANPETAGAYLNKRGRFTIALWNDRPARMEQFAIEGGNWRFEAGADGPLRVTVRIDGADAGSTDVPGTIALPSTEAKEIEVELRTDSSERVEVEDVTLSR